jgi:hypothetical protein
LALSAFHPNHLAFLFATLGYFEIPRVWLYFVVAVTAQAAWWALYASAADMILRQTLVTGSNFQLFLAALFFIWLVYELISVRSRR